MIKAGSHDYSLRPENKTAKITSSKIEKNKQKSFPEQQNNENDISTIMCNQLRLGYVRPLV